MGRVPCPSFEKMKAEWHRLHKDLKVPQEAAKRIQSQGEREPTGKPKTKSKEYHYTRSGADGRMVELDDGTYMVLAGSVLLPDNDDYRNNPRYGLKYQYDLRDDLRRRGKLKRISGENKMELLEPQIFKSRTGAATFITGMTASPKHWM